jgi:Outer membrane efflux protein
LDITGRPAYLLTLDQAAELAMFNNRQYQDQRENLYLAALPVSLERFSFMSQFFAGSEAIRTYAGHTAPGGPENNWALNNGIGLSKVLPTGALLLLNFSNQTVFNFLGPKKTTSVTSLDFTAIQPLLQGGGKAVALESLTEAERNLLYAIRNYARFRKELYVFIASNNGGAISGSAFQPTGVLSSNSTLQVGPLGNSGLTPGVIPPPATTLGGPIVPPASPGVLLSTPAITPTPSGYLNTMLEKITVYIDQENIDVLSDILQRYRGLLEGDLVGPLQVQNVEQQLLTGRYTLLADQQNYLQSLDAFKLEIGVPTNLSIEMDDSELLPLLNQYRRARVITEDERRAVAEASDLIPVENAPVLRSSLRRLFQTSQLSRGTPFASTIQERWAAWQKLSDRELAARLQSLEKQIEQLLDRQAELLKQEKALTPADQARLRSLLNQFDLGSLERLLRQYEADYVAGGKPKKPAPADERKRITLFQVVISAWQRVLVQARDDRWAVVRATWPELPPCCINGVDLVHDKLDRSQQAAFSYALLNRLDLMNVRAQVVDAWRQLAVYANALLGTFTVQYNLSASSPAGAAQPTNIGGSATTNQLILNASPPLTRIEQRNNYRASQIAYQRQRRQLQQAEDLTIQAVDVELTNLRQYAEQYKIQQRQLELAYLTIDSSLESLQAPVAPTPPAGLTRTTADGPAALTQQLLAAQRSLPMAQNALLTIWINYLDQRLQLYRDLEMMPLDARGVWIDKIKECECPKPEQQGKAQELPALPAPRLQTP